MNTIIKRNFISLDDFKEFISRNKVRYDFDNLLVEIENKLTNYIDGNIVIVKNNISEIPYNEHQYYYLNLENDYIKLSEDRELIIAFNYLYK